LRRAAERERRTGVARSAVVRAVDARDDETRTSGRGRHRVELE